MKFAFYTGCVSRGGCPELYTAIVKVTGRLGIELEELKDVACNGAGVLPQYISDPINARTFAKAERLGHSIMTICSTCTGVIAGARPTCASARPRIPREDQPGVSCGRGARI